MGNTNYISVIIKILEPPKQKILKNNIKFTKFRAQLPQTSTSKIINLTFWGNLANDMLQVYTVSDHAIIEGYISLQTKQSSELNILILNQLEITVLRIYPIKL